MSYILQNATSVAAGSQVALPQLATQGVADPIAQQNFESLAKYFQNNASLKNRPKANIVFSKAFALNLGVTGPTGTTAIIKPGAYQVPITSYGNPIRIKLAPLAYSNAYPSFLTTLGTINFGWFRSGEPNPLVTIQDGVSSGTKFITLPAFEFDDVVPAGAYTYQFFFQNTSAVSTNVVYRNLQVVAYELR